MHQLRDYQENAVNKIRTEWSRGIVRTVIVHATGLGKLHPDTTEIQTPDGLRQFSDLTIGDQVFGSDGKPTIVTGVYPNGVMPVYRVHFSDSTSVLAGAEHLWQVKGRSHTCATRIMTTAQIMATDLHAGPSWRWRIPMTDAVARPAADLPIPPYTLGALIANGCLHCKGQPALTTPDYEVITNVEAEGVPAKWLNKGPNSTCPAWSLPTTRAAIRAFGLDVPSGRKFIPSIYLEASIDQRIALLRGLMDADGSSRIGGRRSVNYHTTSAQLAADVQELVWSLGGTASCSSYDRTDEGKMIEYLLCILTPANLYPFGTIRKAQATKPRRTFTPRRAIVAITAEGTTRSRCIRVSAPNSLYLIGREYIVTHNTSIIAKLATDEATAGGRVLLLAHRSEPLDQMTDCCLETDSTISVGRVQAERNEINHRIIAASVQTLCRDKRLATLPKPTMVIIDEAHHGMAASYIKILSWAGSFETTRTLGVTATLIRGDGRGFGELFETVADSKGIDWAVRHHWLVPPRGKAVLLRNLDLQAMTVRHGDYADSELGPVIDAGSEAIVKAWQNNAGDRITVAFTPTIASAQALCASFLAQGVPAEVVIGSTARDDRKAIYNRLAAGHTRVLVSVMVTTEAWDCPPVSCVLIARPTALPGLYQQMMGRGLRLADGKIDCLVLDVVGVSRGQKLVTLVNMVPSALYDDSEIRPRKRRSAVVRPRIVQRVRDWLFSRGY